MIAAETVVPLFCPSLLAFTCKKLGSSAVSSCFNNILKRCCHSMVIAGFLYYLRLLYLHIAMLTSSLPLRYQSSLSLSLGRTNVCMTPRQAFPIALSLFIVQLQSKATTRILIKADLTMFCLPSGSLLWPFQLYTTPSPPRPAIRNCTRSYLDVLERLLEGSIQERLCISMYKENEASLGGSLLCIVMTMCICTKASPRRST